MFGKKKKNDALEMMIAARIIEKNVQAKAMIIKAIEEQETKGDLAYTIGLIDMAYELEIITMNERAALGTKAHEKKLTKI